MDGVINVADLGIKKSANRSNEQEAMKNMMITENPQKLQRAEAIRITKDKDHKRRRHLGIKRKRSVVAPEDFDCDDFEEIFPNQPLQTLHVMKKLIGGDNSNSNFDPQKESEYEDWDYSYPPFEETTVP